MKPALLSILGGAIVLLGAAVFLNSRHGGPDEYPGGSLVPVTQDLTGHNELAVLFPETVTHPCPACGECVHPVEIVENRRTVTLRDHHRWFQLFKAADRIYHFEDLVALAHCLHLPSARDPQGEWRITGRVGPAKHSKGPPHECGTLPVTVTATYELVVGPAPIARVESAVAAPWALAESVQVLQFLEKDSPMVYLAWRLAPGLSVAATPGPCPCGKP